MVLEVKKKIEEKSRVLKSAKKWSDVRDDIIDLFEKGTFPHKVNVFKTKEKGKNQKKIWKKLRINQWILTMNCLKNIFIYQYLVLW